MTKNELIMTVSNLTGCSEQVIREILLTTGMVVADAISMADESAQVPGFGKFTAADMRRPIWPDGKRPPLHWPGEKANRQTRFRPARKFRQVVTGQAA